MSGPGWEATILESSERAADWLRVFGSRTVRVTSPVPVLAHTPAGVRNVYFLKLDTLAVDQRARLVDHVAQRFGLARDEVEREIAAAGVPILSTDVAVPIPLRYLV